MSGVPVESFRWQPFATREALAETLAAEVEASLNAAVSARGRAVLAVSGGSTPELFFQHLSRRPADWAAVTVTLCDERFVEPASPRSNEGLVRRTLLQNLAGRARFVPLVRPGASLEDAAAQAGIALTALPLPLDVAVLGMGEDGHTASFFPDSPDLVSALDPAGTDVAMALHSPSAGEPRLTLTLPVLARARRIVLHIEGEHKRETFQRAVRSETPPPIGTVIERAERPIDVFWAP